MGQRAKNPTPPTVAEADAAKRADPSPENIEAHRAAVEALLAARVEKRIGRLLREARRRLAYSSPPVK